MNIGPFSASRRNRYEERACSRHAANGGAVRPQSHSFGPLQQSLECYRLGGEVVSFGSSAEEGSEGGEIGGGEGLRRGKRR